MPLYTKQLPETLQSLEKDVQINKDKLDELVYTNASKLSEIYSDEFISNNIINNIDKLRFGIMGNGYRSWHMPCKGTRAGSYCYSKEGFLYCYNELKKPKDTYNGLIPNQDVIVIVPNIEQEYHDIDYWSCYVLSKELVELIVNSLNK